MIGEADARCRRHRRADDVPRPARARRHRTRPAGPRREAAGGDASPRASSSCAAARARRRPAPGRPRRALQPGRARARRRRLAKGWLGTLYSITSRRAGPFPARIRDVGVTIDLATHDADILSWIAGERPTRVYAETGAAAARQQRGPAVRAAPLPVGRDGHARRQLADAGEAAPADRGRRVGHVRARLPHPAPDVHQRRRRQPDDHRRLRDRPSRATSSTSTSRATSRSQAELDAFSGRSRDRAAARYVDGEDGAVGAARSRPACCRPPPTAVRSSLVDAGRAPRDVVRRPTSSAASLGGARSACRERLPARPATTRRPWTGEPGHGRDGRRRRRRQDGPSAGRPVRLAWLERHRRRHQPDGRRRDQRGPRARRRGAGTSPSAWRDAHAAGRLRATHDGAAAAREADVVVLIVPGHARRRQPAGLPAHGRRRSRRSPRASTPARPSSSRRRCPSGDTRDRYAPAAGARSRPRRRPRPVRRVLAGAPVHGGGVRATSRPTPSSSAASAPASTDRAAQFYASVLDAEVVAMSSAEAAELSKLADTTYRDVNIAFANELARMRPTRTASTSRRSSRRPTASPTAISTSPGIGVGGHCIPVYPHLLLAGAPGLRLVEAAGQVNDGQVDRAVATLDAVLGGLAGVPVLVLGLTYREGVKELAYSRALPLIERLRAAGASVSAWDPLLDDDEVRALGATPWPWGEPGTFRADRHPDRRPDVRHARPGVVPGARGRARRAQQPSRRRPAAGRDVRGRRGAGRDSRRRGVGRGTQRACVSSRSSGRGRS